MPKADPPLAENYILPQRRELLPPVRTKFTKGINKIFFVFLCVLGAFVVKSFLDPTEIGC